MFNKGSKLYSMITGTCPKCQEDSMYVNNNPYVLSQTMTMHDRCRNCGFKYKVEPNFFFGAMYVSYAISILVGTTIFLVGHYLLHAGLVHVFIAIFVSLIFLMPVVTRLSRNVYINLFVNYDKNAGKHKHDSQKL